MFASEIETALGKVRHKDPAQEERMRERELQRILGQTPEYAQPIATK